MIPFHKYQYWNKSITFVLELPKQKMQQQEFKETSRGLTMLEAIEEAKRCLNCKKPLCVPACPIAHDIPGFIFQLSKGNFGESMAIINDKSNLPAICGRVCPHERQCEGHCILNKKDNPIQIGKLERFIADFDSEMTLIKEKLPQKTLGKIAIIGSGPAGLSVAGDLAKMGFNVVVFEGQEEAGGVLLYGIPEYRLPREIVRREIKKIEGLGVNFFYNTLIGRDITIDEIFEQNFDAIFIGSGTAVPKTMNVNGTDLQGVIQSSYLLGMTSIFQNGSVGRDRVPVQAGEIVYVIGAGNVAMDSARTAIRLGAKSVTVVYYKGIENMSALKAEYEEAVEEGVKFLWHTQTLEFRGTVGQKLSGIKLSNTEGENIYEADRIVLAIGSKPANKIVSSTKGIEVDESGYVLTSKHPYGMTTKKGVFAGGDVVHSPQTVVLAMREAKEVAKGIAKYVEAVKMLGL